MLDNVRRKLSHSNYKTFRNNTSDLCRGDNIVCYKNILFRISTERCAKKTSTKSFKPFQKSSKDVSLGKVYMKMIFCPAGKFTMGHVDFQNQEVNNPPRTETIDLSFLLGETEITQDLYLDVMDKSEKASKSKKSNPPIVGVTWFNAIEFCNRLSLLQGLDLCYVENSRKRYDWFCDFRKNGYRLPTEKEWEYAAKAGTENRWSGTDDGVELERYAWFDKNSKKSIKNIATKLPNEWGFYDMSGNVKEWCWDRWDPDPNLPPMTLYRVTRGGSSMGKVEALRSANREGCLGSNIYSRDIGFRVCRTLV